jgi:hypothetical protein
MKKSPIFLVLIALFLAGCAKQEDPFTQRERILNDWIRAGIDICRKTNDPIAKQSVEFFFTHATLCEPSTTTMQAAVRPIEVANDNQEILVAPILGDDFSTNATWGKHYARKGVLFLVNDLQSPFVMIKGEIPLSRTWKGLVLIRENMRARFDTQNSLRDQGTSAYVAYAKMFALLADPRVSPGYGKLLAREVSKVSDRTIVCSDGTINKAVEFPDKHANDEELDVLFGKPLSADEHQIRDFALWLNIAFGLIDEKVKDPEEATRRKINLMEMLVKAGTLI